jgi:uncharacterized cupin superfamily protein
MRITEGVNTIKIETGNSTLTLTKSQAFELSEELVHTLENLKHYPDYLPYGSRKEKETAEKKDTKKRLQVYRHIQTQRQARLK